MVFKNHNELVKFGMYNAIGAISCFALYVFVKKIKAKVMNRNTTMQDDDDDEIAEVMWTNELSRNCGGSYAHQNQLCDKSYCAHSNCLRITQYFDNAKYSIDLAMYTFSLDLISDALIRAFNRGVVVRFICDREMFMSSGSQVNRLTRKGIAIRYQLDHTILMHHKFCIIDNEKRSRTVAKLKNQEYNENTKSILLTGSLNWTKQGFNCNYENIAVMSSKRLVEKFEEEFERLWQMFEVNIN